MYYDVEYALRICSEHKITRACVFIYSAMGLYQEAVRLALQVSRMRRFTQGDTVRFSRGGSVRCVPTLGRRCGIPDGRGYSRGRLCEDLRLRRRFSRGDSVRFALFMEICREIWVM